MNTIPLCRCGCGQPVSVPTYTNKKLGYIKGQPNEYLLGHWARGKTWKRCTTLSLEEAFWKNVKKSEGCWDWIGELNGAGYGIVRKGFAHRISWEIHNGKIPERIYVCHKCDNPPCTNPAHLFLGTCADNVADMIAKGRHAKGEKVPQSVITADVARKIMEIHRVGGKTMSQIASDVGHGANADIVWQIVHGHSWRWAVGSSSS